MTDLEYRVERARFECSNAESKLREATQALKSGYIRLNAAVEQAKADMERDYSKLKEEVERAANDLKMEQAFLKTMEANLEKGFEAN